MAKRPQQRPFRFVCQLPEVADLPADSFADCSLAIKTVIVRLAIWGLLPAGFAQWLINALGLRGA